MRSLVLDIEANALDNPTVIHCICTVDLSTGEEREFVGQDLESFLDYAENYTVWIGHNIIGYDYPTITKILGEKSPKQLHDTLTMSRLYNYNIEGGHSLRAWGVRLKFLKGDFTGPWDSYSSAMLVYCKQDVALTKKLYEELTKRMPYQEWRDAYHLEWYTQWVLGEASKRGFAYDKEQADQYKVALELQIEKIDQDLVSLFPPKVIQLKTKVKYEDFNPNSIQQVIDKLWEAGWKPKEKTDGHVQFLKGKAPNPSYIDQCLEYYKSKDHYAKYGWKVNEENLSTVPDDAPAGLKAIIRRRILASRVAKLEEWERAYNPNTGAIHGNFDPLGTWSQRVAHQKPNMANVSAKKSIKYRSKELNDLATGWGGRFRSLWTSRPGYKLVGTDAEGIQLRILAHYMNDPEFTKAVTSGNKEDGTDPHTMNMKRLGTDVCRSRDTAKTFIYAFLLGAGDSKIAEILGISSRRAKGVKESFVGSYPGLKDLKEKLIPSDARRGYFIGVDGRKVRCDSEHLMMAGYLQNTEAVIMKKAIQIANTYIAGYNIPAYLINFVHDEMIFEVEEGYEEQVKVICEDAICIAGEVLNLNCPMKGEGKIGKTWLDTH